MSRLRRAIYGVVLCSGLAGALDGQVTESPHTVKPGSFLLEMDGVRVEADRVDGAGNTYDVLGVGGALVTTGLTANLDVQLGFQLFHRETVEIGGRRESDSGLGDLTLRSKWTFWRDEEWGAAAAVIPYVKVPTNSGVGNDAVEGGLIVPWAMEAAGGFVSGAMFRWDVVRNPADNGYDARWGVSGFVERKLMLGITAYAEAILETASSGTSDSAGLIGAGARWTATRHIELDFQVLKGLNARASAWTQVFRVNWRW